MNNRRAAISERLNFITNRKVLAWNSLPAETINAGSVNAFKSSIDEHTERSKANKR